MAKIFLMTDKEKTKDVACTHPACDNIVRVNTFYAPSKARCPDHGGKALSREPVEMKTKNGKETDQEKFSFKRVEPKLVEDTPDQPKKKNKSLGRLCCPLCDEPMNIISVDDSERFITFGCMDVACNTSVEIQYNFRHAVVRRVPSQLQVLVESFNLQATMARVAS